MVLEQGKQNRADRAPPHVKYGFKILKKEKEKKGPQYAIKLI